MTGLTRRQMIVGGAAVALLPALARASGLSSEPVGEFVFSLDGEAYSSDVFPSRAAALAAASADVREQECDSPGETVIVYTAVPRWISNEDQRPDFAEDHWTYWADLEHEHGVAI